MNQSDYPRLIADIGGTYARFALETSTGQFEHLQLLPCAQFADFFSAVRAYLKTAGQPAVEHAAIAIAYPVSGDLVRMTNYHWQFSIEEMRIKLGLETLVVVNDFTALAMAVPRLRSDQLRQVGGGEARDDSVIGVLGAGSGLGVSGLIPSQLGWVALGTEGGHASVSPADDQELRVLQYAWKEFKHVSFERLLSGAGLELIYRALQSFSKTKMTARSNIVKSAAEITQGALSDQDQLCVQTTQMFCGLLGTAAANLALTLGATGGIYIGGGIVPRLGEFFDRSAFRARFEDKGRFGAYLKPIPTFVITAANATFEGASAILAAQLKSIAASPRSGLLDRTRRSLATLSPAEQRVAQHVLAHTRKTLTQPVAEIAETAGVSQPTVIRFCRSLGCEGLSDFKLRLASELRGTLPITHAQVTDQDSVQELSGKVLGNTASALLQVRERINNYNLSKAVSLLARAARIDCYALDEHSVIAQDAQYKFLRMGIASSAYTQSHLIEAAASTSQAGTVALLISSHGMSTALEMAADALRERNCAVVVITASQSPLAKRATVAIEVDHNENNQTHVPMISRILHLLVIDILSVSIAIERSGKEFTLSQLEGNDFEDQVLEPKLAASSAKESKRRGLLGVRTAHPLTDISSHSRENHE